VSSRGWVIAGAIHEVTRTDSEDPRVVIKPPTLFNYTQDALAPLYFRSRDLITGGPERWDEERQGKVCAVYFLRLDPRIMAVRGAGGEADPWRCYSSLLDTLNDGSRDSPGKHLIAAWASLGAFHLTFLFACGSFAELRDVRTKLRNFTKFRPDGATRDFHVASASSTLIILPPGGCNPDTSEVGFSILVKLWSGVHGEAGKKAIGAVTASLGLGARSFMDRQGSFDGVIRIKPGEPFEKVRTLIRILEECCPFVEDVATVVGFEWRSRSTRTKKRILPRGRSRPPVGEGEHG
jgi:hypothetical protein